jgi:hypothetical protein
MQTTCDFILDSLNTQTTSKAAKGDRRNLCNVLNARAAREAAVARMNLFCLKGKLKYKP